MIAAADWQMCSGNELTSLDTSYCDLLPDLFKNMPQVVEVTASCSSGFRGHSCQAPAVVPVEVQLRTKVGVTTVFFDLTFSVKVRRCL